MSGNDTLVALTGVLAVATIWYAWQTQHMVRETRNTRLMGLQPNLAVELSVLGPLYAEVRVQNTGQGAAHHVAACLIFEANGNEEEASETRHWMVHIMMPGDSARFSLPRPDDGQLSLDQFCGTYQNIRFQGTYVDVLGTTHKFQSETGEPLEWWSLKKSSVQLLEWGELHKVEEELRKGRQALEKLASNAKSRDSR